MLTKRKSCIIGNRHFSECKLAGSAELGKSRVGGWTLFERIMITQPESTILGKFQVCRSGARFPAASFHSVVCNSVR